MTARSFVGISSTHRRALEATLAGAIEWDVPLARYSTYRIGGPAWAVVSPRTIDDVVAAIRYCADAQLPWLPIGLGSNVLFDDAGYHGVIIRPSKAMAGTESSGGIGEWTVGAGLPTPLLAKRSAAAGLSGVHRLVGVPGAVGGGVFMNAGAHGQEFRDVVQWVRLVTPSGQAQEIPGQDIRWQYRESGLVGCIVEARVRLVPDDPDALQRELRGYLRIRREKTPFDQPCCGSVFRNPPPPTGVTTVAEPHTAGRLIEAAGLKGLRIGGAEVSALHANYIVNIGGASAEQVRAVIEEVRRRVHDEYGVDLQREVQFIAPDARMVA